MIRHALAVSLLFLPTSLAAAPTVSVVVGSKAPSLELDAAGELTSQWKKVFGVTAGIVRDKAPDTGVAVLVGSPTTNPAVANAVGKAATPSAKTFFRRPGHSSSLNSTSLKNPS